MKNDIVEKLSGLLENENYVIHEEIGSGANGQVFKGVQKNTDRKVAIKVWIPNKKSKNGKVSEEQFLREVQKVAQLKHKNIVTIYDAKILEGFYICIMEYVSGITLKEWLRRNHSKGKKIALLTEVLDTVLFYQEKGIIHGDLHGRNIIVKEEGQIQIIDFGTRACLKNKICTKRMFFVPFL